ncbi:hypothetical protein [uncultured Pontibacter sp.]|uniref:hypothetical protein n=1 Tax=uncultured Pontibacter sp. TaxID=453356 RepID=UPI00261B56C9|nr:hypothetical protein [uncultured Pontibacter sp.]
MSKGFKKATYISLTAIIVIVAWNVIAHYYSKRFHEDVKSSPKKYSYDISREVLNPVMVITDLKYKQDLVEYYDKLSSGESTPVFHFPLNSILLKEPVYVIGATPDSQLIEVVLYLTEDLNGNYMRGYMDKRTLHDLPAPDSFWNEQSKVNYSMEELFYLDSIQSSL